MDICRVAIAMLFDDAFVALRNGDASTQSRCMTSVCDTCGADESRPRESVAERLG